MRREFLLALVTFVFSTFIAAQQASPPTPPPTAITQTAAPPVYYAGPGVTAPELLSIIASVSAPRHCNEYDGIATLSAIIDTNGVPNSVKFLSGDIRLSDVATATVASQRFKPGTYNRAPSAVAITATLGLQTCWRLEKSASRRETYEYSLRSHPLIAVGILARPSTPPENANAKPGNVSPSFPNGTPAQYSPGGSISKPLLLSEVEAEYPDVPRKERISGVCLIGLVVDVNGMPQNVHVIKSLGPDFDQSAIDAVSQFRFNPAMKDGRTPVPVEITVEVNFKLVKRKFF